jgi:acetyltransferase
LRVLQKSKIPNYSYPERAVFAFDKMYHYRTWQISPFALPEALEADRDRASSLLSLALLENRSHLRPNEVFEIFACYNIRIPKSLLARDAKQAVAHAGAIGFPVVLKVASLQITHKSDLGGVRIGLRDEEAVRLAFEEIMYNCSTAAPEASIEGVTVQEMVERGRELIVGAHRDPLFGPVIMFGLGGIYVETLQDVSFRIAPLTMEDTTMMMREIRSFPIIAGIRGEEPSDVGAVQKTVLSVSRIMEDHPEIQEMDINPLKALTFGKGAFAVDGRIALKLRTKENGS